VRGASLFETNRLPIHLFDNNRRNKIMSTIDNSISSIDKVGIIKYNKDTPRGYSILYKAGRINLTWIWIKIWELIVKQKAAVSAMRVKKEQLLES